MIREIESSWKKLLSIILSNRKPKTSSSGADNLVKIEKEWVRKNDSISAIDSCILADAPYLHYAFKQKDDSVLRNSEHRKLTNYLYENPNEVRYVDYPNSSSGMLSYFVNHKNTSVDVVSPEEYFGEWLIDKITQQKAASCIVIGKMSHRAFENLRLRCPGKNIIVYVHEDDVNQSYEMPLSRLGGINCE
jgi:hypothetical protein